MRLPAAFPLAPPVRRLWLARSRTPCAVPCPAYFAESTLICRRTRSSGATVVREKTFASAPESVLASTAQPVEACTPAAVAAARDLGWKPSDHAE